MTNDPCPWGKVASSETVIHWQKYLPFAQMYSNGSHRTLRENAITSRWKEGRVRVKILRHLFAPSGYGRYIRPRSRTTQCKWHCTWPECVSSHALKQVCVSVCVWLVT
jgi:hypothetical protein